MMHIITIDSPREWDAVMQTARMSTFYHSHAYHTFCERRGEGQSLLFVYREGDFVIGLPVLIRPLGEGGGFAGDLGVWRDATSVYGYVGPVCSRDKVAASVVARFQKALGKTLFERRVIAVFSRLHPLIPNGRLIEGLGDQQCCGVTVAIDLTLPPEEQVRRFRDSDRRRIKGLRKKGMTVVYDEKKEHLSEFATIYTQTMRRVGARDSFFFDEAYFRGMCELAPERTHLFVVKYEGNIISGGFLMEAGGVLEYHSCGTRSEYLPLSPAKLMLDEIRLWGCSRGLLSLHLGGGTGGENDQLLYFKTGFSDRVHPFSIWRWVIDQDAYEIACRYKAARDACLRMKVAIPNFFPAYRSPVTPEPETASPAALLPN